VYYKLIVSHVNIQGERRTGPCCDPLQQDIKEHICWHLACTGRR
jgi:hypothetical protein